MSARKKLIIFVLTGWLISAELIPAINVSAIEEQASPSPTRIEEELNLESLITALEPTNSAETPATSSADPDLSLEPTMEVMPSPTLGVTLKEKRKRPILKKNNLQAKEKVEIEVGDYQLSDLQINLVDKDGKEITVEKNLEEGRLKINPSRQFFPGKYHLTITSGQETLLEQDFTWGVLAINVNKSIYLPGETAKLAMAVLDEQGKMVCDALLKLKINPPAGGEKSELSTENGQIIINPECQLHDFTLTPDYEALYQVKGPGKYEMTLSAQTPNGDFTITDFFEVKESVKFDVERDTATRIYPPKIYPVTFNITSFEDFEGEIEEVVPKDFQISPAVNNHSYDEIKEQNDEKIIIWKVSLKKNEKISLGYRFKAPDISPQFYLLGPLTFRNLNPSGHEEEIVFQEGRQWQIASDAPPAYKMATGRYVGSGNYKQVSGFGFAPEAVIIKASTTGGVGGMLKTTSMIDNYTAYLGSATADDTTGLITLDPDGFTVTGTNANIANTTWTWAAFAGSNCSSAGQFCIGRYTGNGTSPRLIDTGFQPDIAMVKNAAVTTAANFQTVGMTANYAQYLMATAQDTTGALFTSFSGTGFNVGATNNTSAAIYNFIAFKNVSGSINVGSFTGNGTSQSITGAGFAPDLVITKNTTAATAVGAVYNVDASYGDSSSYFTDTANVVGAITALTSDGFNVGSNSTANGSTNTIFWMAFYGTTAISSSGTFKMATGTYVGNGAYQNINGLGFAPDLVIIKGNTTAAGVFRTTQHNGDFTSYLDAATADFALGIQSLNPDGFNIGTNATVNSSGVNYYWTAYGNAWRPAANSGASDFVIGTYYGNGIDSRNITGLPFQPDLVVIKGAGAQAATFRTSQHSGDSSSFFTATIDGADRIQAFNSDGFQIGINANVNTAATFYRYFAFKSGSNFTVNTYSGNGTSQSITTVGFQPDNLWIKTNAATRGVQRTGNMATNSALPFINVGNVNNAVTGLLSNGFSVGSAAETNTSGSNNYRYVAWRVPGITVSTSGTQTSSLNIPSTNNYVGAAFTFMANISSIDITLITITETGTVNANSNLSNVKFYYETAGTCSYDANETQFGTTQSFNASEKTSFTGIMTIGTSQVCGYVVLDVGSGASGGQTVDIEIAASTDVISSTGLIYGSFPAALSESTTLSSGNQSPNSPSSLAQKKTDDTVISTGGWVNQTSVKFTATASDPDSSDTLSLCVEKDILGTNFSNTEDSCGTGVAYSGSPVTVTVTISGITDANEYHWQARVKDAASAYSSWVSYPTPTPNAESARDFGIDTTAPTGGTIYDGTETGVDRDFNDGSLSQLSANWSGFNANVSGLNYYEYSIGTTAGGTNIKNWTNVGVETSATATDLTLQTSVLYYFNVRATDNATNTQLVVSSDGQIVSPSLTFSVAPSTLSFANLNAGNSYTDTKQATLTTSTNAYGGYVVRNYMTDYLRSADSNFTIPDFDGGTYASPGTWGGGNKGFGYTSSDTTIQGADKFGGGTLYAPFSQTGLGDIIADHTNNVTGNPITNEQFTLTFKIKTNDIQQASSYITTAVYTATAQY